jgi:phosphoglycerol transferase MdoB-like AlkP superfamily enzyme
MLYFANRVRPFAGSALRLLFRILCFILAWTVLFGLMRLILVAATWSHHGDATTALLLESFLRGARFDLSIAAKLGLLFTLWMIWRPIPGRWEMRIAFSVFAIVAFLSIFALIAEVEFYKEFEQRLGRLAFEFFSTKSEHNSIILGMVWDGYPVIRWMLVCFAIWGLFVWLMRPLLIRNIPAKSACATRVTVTVLWISLSAVAFRGGLQQSVLRWGDGYFSQNPYANQMAQNGIFTLIDALRHPESKQKFAAKWEHSLSSKKTTDLVRAATLLPGEELVDPEHYLLLRTSPPSSIAIKRPQNVVVVIMESFTARFCGAVGANFGATPNYDALAQEGILFDRAFSVGTHTAQGVYGTLCSFPHLPDFETLMKQPIAQQPFRSLPAILGESGFETLFLYNGLFSWDNKEGFFRNHGMQRFIGRNDYINPTFVDPDWGVSDHDVFNRAVKEFSQIAQRKKPFLGVVLTLSNHSPFNLPKIPRLNHIEGGGEQNQRLNGIHYADWALGEFIKAAKQASWFNDTLFVFVGDHGFAIPPQLTELGLLHMHVPLLFYGPKILGTQHETRHTIASQLDIVPSILGILGSKSPHQSFGRDLFRLSAEDQGHACLKDSGGAFMGWIEGDQALIGESGKPVSLYQHDFSFPPGVIPEAIENSESMTEHLQAFVQAGIWTLKQRRAAPGPTSSRQPVALMK